MRSFHDLRTELEESGRRVSENPVKASEEQNGSSNRWMGKTRETDSGKTTNTHSIGEVVTKRN